MHKLQLYLLCVVALSSCKVKQTSTSTNKDKDLFPTHVKSVSDVKQEQYFIEGCRRKISGNFNASVAQFNEVLTINPQNDAALYNLAMIYLDKREYEKALQYIISALKLNNSNKWYKVAAADIYEATGRYSDAAGLMQSLAKQYPNEPDYLSDEAYFYIKSLQYEKAIAVFNQLEKITGLTEEIATARKNLWLNLNKPEKAIAELNSLIQAYPNEPSYYGMLADLYTTLNMNERALQTVQKLAAMDSTNLKAQSMMADYYLNQQDYDHAFPYLKNVFRSSEITIDYKVKTLFTYLNVLQQIKRRNEAILLGSLLIAAHPNEAKAYAINGDILFQSGEDAEALDMYYKTLRIDKSRFIVWQQVFLLQTRLGLKSDLLSYTEEAKELFPYQPLVFYYNGLAWLDKKEYNKAISSLETMIRFDSEDTGLRSQAEATLGDCYNAIQDYTMADHHYDNALEIDPNNVYALNNYAYNLALRGVKLDKAEQMASKVVMQLAQSNPNYIDTYAWVLYKQKKYSAALSWMEKAITPSTKSPSVLEHYGDILFQSGRIDDAIKFWQRALDNGGDKQLLQKKINERKLAD